MANRKNAYLEGLDGLVIIVVDMRNIVEKNDHNRDLTSSSRDCQVLYDSIRILLEFWTCHTLLERIFNTFYTMIALFIGREMLLKKVSFL